MKIFLDSAEISEIKKYAEWGVVDGVTTNPTLVAKAGVSFETRIREIAEVISGPISAEVLAVTADEMIAEGRKIAQWAPNVVVKIPMTSEGIRAVRTLSAENIPTNVTLIFSPNQALIAAKAGATFVSPFFGRLDDAGHDAEMILSEMVGIFETFQFPTQILSASIRTTGHFFASARSGADVATIPPALLEKIIAHPLTDIGLSAFLQDIENAKNLFSISPKQ